MIHSIYLVLLQLQVSKLSLKTHDRKLKKKFVKKTALLHHAYRDNLIRSCFQYEVSEYLLASIE